MNFKVFKNIFWLLAERIIQVVSAFVISGLISRQLGVAEYGDFQYVLSIILIFSAVGLVCSAEVLLPKIVSADQNKLTGFVASGFLLRLCASVCAYILILIYGCVFIDSRQMFFLLSILGLTVIFREPFAVVIVFFQSQTFSKPIAIASISILFFKSIIVAIAYYIKGINFNTLCAIWILEVLISSLIFSILYVQEIKKRSIQFKWTPIDFKKLLIEGAVYWAPLLLMTFFWRVDRIIVKIMTPAYEAGIYLAAMQLFDAIVSVALIVSVSLAPSLIYQYSDRVKIKTNAWKLVFLMSIAGSISALLGYFLAPYIVLYVFGASFIDAISIVQTAFVISLLVFIDAAFNIYLIKCLGAKHALIKWTLIVFIALPVEYFSVRLWGAHAAHIGIAFGYSFAILFGFFQLKIK
jgi:O-antigen/teichoic acid export membrane protein